MTSSQQKDARYEAWRWRIFGITWLAYVGFYLTRSSFAVAKIAMLADHSLQISTRQMGLIDGLYLTAYAVGMFVWGALGDRRGPRVIVLIGIFGSVAAAFAMGLSSIVMLFGIFSVVQGLSQSTGWAPLTKNIGNWFSLRERGRVIGWWSTNYAIGALVAAPFAGWIADYYGSWRFAFFMPGAVLAVIGLLFILLQRNQPADVGLPPIETYHAEAGSAPAKPRANEAAEGSWRAIAQVARSPMVLLLGAVYFLLKPTRYAILFWGPLYISEKLHTGMAKSAVINIAFFLAGPLSVILAGYFSDKVFQARRLPYCVICLFLLGLVLFFFNSIVELRHEALIAVTLFVMGLLLYGPDSLISATAAVDFGTTKGASTASGLINGLGSIGAIVGGTVPGFFKESWGWNGVFVFLGASVMLGAVLMLPKWNALPPPPAAD